MTKSFNKYLTKSIQPIINSNCLLSNCFAKLDCLDLLLFRPTSAMFTFTVGSTGTALCLFRVVNDNSLSNSSHFNNLI